MRPLPLQVFPFLSKSTNTLRKTTIGRSVITIVCASAMVMAGVVTGLMRQAGATPNLGLPNPGAVRLPALKLGNAVDGIAAQMIMNGPRTGLNPEFFNALRQRAVTKDSQKLLRLAIALKAEIDGSSGTEPPPDAIAKAKEIEKLAKDVKSKMTVNPF